MNKAFTFAELDSVLRVDGAQLIWKVTRGKARAGSCAGRMDKQGYIVLQYMGCDLQAHRVIWLLTNGEWPIDKLDHIDGRRDNNLPSNLRPCSSTENQRNRKPSGKFKGITRLPHGRYQAQCANKYLGCFDTDELAALAYDAEALKRYGQFAWLNFRSQP